MKQSSMHQLRRVSLILTLVLVLVATTACGSDQNGTDQNNTPGEEAVSIGLTSFQTQDIYGVEQDQSLFRDYTLTLVNVWGTFCGPCLDEMPFLGELQNEYESQGVNIVGIVVDVQDENLEVQEDQIKLAQEIAEGTGADYPHLIISEEMMESVLSQFDAIPASFFVDSDGNIVSEYYIGSRAKEDWVDIIETNLKNRE